MRKKRSTIHGSKAESRRFPLHVSNVWWHFTGYNKDAGEAFEILKKIIKSKQIKATTSEILLEPTPSYSPLRSKSGETAVIEGPRACLADIPKESLPHHAIRYGIYAVGLLCTHLRSDRKLAINPVLYTAGPLQRKVAPYLTVAKPLQRPFQDVRPFLKICGCNENFEDLYREREWRSTRAIPVNKHNLVEVLVSNKNMREIKRLLGRAGFRATKIVSWERHFGPLPDRIIL